MYEWVLILIFWNDAGGITIDFNTRDACVRTQDALQKQDSWDGRIKISYCAHRGTKPDGKVEK